VRGTPAAPAGEEDDAEAVGEATGGDEAVADAEAVADVADPDAAAGEDEDEHPAAPTTTAPAATAPPTRRSNPAELIITSTLRLERL
jgi:hypothetical protein